MKTIAVIGGLGYAGGFIVDNLRGSGHQITVFAQNNLDILGIPGDNVSIRSLDSVSGTEKFDVIINLAFPSSYSRKMNFESDKKMVDAIRTLSGQNTIIIHTSTLVVFGSGLDKPIKRERISFRRETEYAEVKLHMENLLEKYFRRNKLHIIRLGNVWGPGAPSWLHHVADRLVFRDSFPESVSTAPSNITYIYNLTDFIRFLIEQDSSESEVKFYHFAEFASVTWGTIIENLGSLLGEKPVYMPYKSRLYKNLFQELFQITDLIMPRAVFYRMLNMRILSSYARNIVDIFPVKYRNILKKDRLSAIPAIEGKDKVFACQVLFKHETGTAWKPKFSFEAALETITDSLKESGYLLKENL